MHPPLECCYVNRAALTYSRRTRNTVKAASDKHVCSPCGQGYTSVYIRLFTQFFMSRLMWALWGLTGLMFERLPGFSHYLWLQVRLLDGAVSGIISADL